ncbi:hypothetical protein MYCTH_2295820 [Thermothelomyces thermophilus ATCC 42464]|uniref:Uncharacterized protein n=1 Tax=Thermothelomyces thermophilus (strain ATCC 42464 / BCRC 31852 / DSM 1799) TaxID=573729 RepID=G2Q6C8_THET4|nr:uncharacterized protein MYCTH_2295820 [Thermothelomyces thermophilus ATCC 42464]AEO53898.1 hypothetical protein MYCTH_2295820 [Thermothelomyces thermophilus ATCC 42464]
MDIAIKEGSEDRTNHVILTITGGRPQGSSGTLPNRSTTCGNQPAAPDRLDIHERSDR